MPIFDTNATGRLGVKVEAARGYSDHDVGRVISECAINDMRVFNASLARDFHEAAAIHEGTMVKSELQAFREASLKDAWAKISEKLQKFWSKIKGIFRSVYAKLSLWINKNTKLYVAQNKTMLMKKRNLDSCKLPKYQKPKKSMSEVVDGLKETLKRHVDAIKASKEDTSAAYGITQKGDDKKSNYERLDKECFNEPDTNLTWGSLGDTVQALCNRLTDGAEYLKAVKDANKECDKSLGELIKWCKQKSKEEKGNENEEASKRYQSAVQGITNLQTNLTAEVNATLKVIKKAISNDRGLMAALVAHNPAGSSDTPAETPAEQEATTEFAYLTGVESFFREADDLTDEEVAEEAEENGITITIEIENDSDADVDVDDDEA